MNFILQKIIALGGGFPMPPAVAYLCTLLPPPNCFTGPFVSTDHLIDIFNRIKLPDKGNQLFFKYLSLDPSLRLSNCMNFSAASIRKQRRAPIRPGQVGALDNGREQWRRGAEAQASRAVVRRVRRRGHDDAARQRHLPAAAAETSEISSVHFFLPVHMIDTN